MEFRILGPVEMHISGQTQAVTAAKHRAILAALLIHANQTVSVTELVDLVWGECSPRLAAVVIRDYVSQIRKALPGQVLETTAIGYQIHLDTDWIDLHRFEGLVAGARRIRHERPADAAATIGEALGLWRGPALADLDDAPLQHIEAPRIEEMRLAAIEELIDIQLDLGRHTELVPELSGLWERHPTRERMAGQLMRALHRCGRTPDALAAYQQAYDRLVDESGLPPGRELRLLYQSIRQDRVAVDGLVD